MINEILIQILIATLHFEGAIDFHCSSAVVLDPENSELAAVADCIEDSFSIDELFFKKLQKKHTQNKSNQQNSFFFS